MFHQPHPGITRPTLLVVVADDVLVVRVRVLGQVPLDEVPGLLGAESEEHVDAVDVSRVESDGVRNFGVDILKRKTASLRYKSKFKVASSIVV